MLEQRDFFDSYYLHCASCPDDQARDEGCSYEGKTSSASFGVVCSDRQKAAHCLTLVNAEPMGPYALYLTMDAHSPRHGHNHIPRCSFGFEAAPLRFVKTQHTPQHGQASRPEILPTAVRALEIVDCY